MAALQTAFTNLQTIITAVNQADAPPQAAEQLAYWLGEHVGSTVIAIVNLESSDLQYYTSSGFVPAATLIQWMESPDSWLSWQGWTAPRWHTMAEPVPELAADDTGLLLPLSYAGSVRGMGFSL